MISSAIIVNFAFLLTVNALGEFTVLHHPTSLTFKGHEHLRQSTLKDVFSASVGFSTSQFSNWNGLYIEDPFTLAKAIATVAVEGVADIAYGKGHQFPLKNDEDEYDVYSALKQRILERYPEADEAVFRVDLANGVSDLQDSDILGAHANEIQENFEGTTYSLKANIEEDNQFLQEVNLLNQISHLIEKHVPTSGAGPKVFWFRVSALRPLIDLYGENSTKVNDAKLLLKDSILELSESLRKAYNGQILVAVINNAVVQTRKARNILEVKDAPVPDERNIGLAKYYSPDYPAIFNIILWFGVAMVFSLLAVCLAIASMDPGRDSIIYRMTSTRLKKDN